MTDKIKRPVSTSKSSNRKSLGVSNQQSHINDNSNTINHSLSNYRSKYTPKGYAEQYKISRQEITGNNRPIVSKQNKNIENNEIDNYNYVNEIKKETERTNLKSSDMDQQFKNTQSNSKNLKQKIHIHSNHVENFSKQIPKEPFNENEYYTDEADEQEKNVTFEIDKNGLRSGKTFIGQESIDYDMYSRIKETRESIASSVSSEDKSVRSTNSKSSNVKKKQNSEAYYMQLAHRLMHSNDGKIKQRMAEKKLLEQQEAEEWFQPNLRRYSSSGRRDSVLSAASFDKFSNTSSRPGSAILFNRHSSTPNIKRRQSFDPNYVPVHQRVHSDLLVHSEKIKKLSEKYSDSDKFTFKPEISKKSQEIIEEKKRRSLLNEINENGEQEFAARPTINSAQYLKQLQKEVKDRESLSEKPQISKYSEEILKSNPLYQNVNFLERQQYLFMESERARLENAENSRPTFQPTISKNSDKISLYRRSRQSIQSEASKLVGKDDLFGYYKDNESSESFIDPTCTFHPQINEYSKSIAKAHTIDDLIAYKDEKRERIEKQQQLQEELSLKKCTFKPKLVAKQTEEWLRKSMQRDSNSPSIRDRNFLNARYEREIKSQEDVSECTFKPNINKNLKIDPNKSVGFVPERKQYDPSKKTKQPIVKGLESFFDRVKRMNDMKKEEEDRKKERLNLTTDYARESGFLSNHHIDQIPNDFTIVGPLMAQRTQRVEHATLIEKTKY